MTTCPPLNGDGADPLPSPRFTCGRPRRRGGGLGRLRGLVVSVASASRSGLRRLLRGRFFLPGGVYCHRPRTWGRWGGSRTYTHLRCWAPARRCGGGLLRRDRPSSTSACADGSRSSRNSASCRAGFRPSIRAARDRLQALAAVSCHHPPAPRRRSPAPARGSLPAPPFAARHHHRGGEASASFTASRSTSRNRVLEFGKQIRGHRHLHAG